MVGEQSRQGTAVQVHKLYMNICAQDQHSGILATVCRHVNRKPMSQCVPTVTGSTVEPFTVHNVRDSKGLPSAVIPWTVSYVTNPPCAIIRNCYPYRKLLAAATQVISNSMPTLLVTRIYQALETSQCTQNKHTRETLFPTVHVVIRPLHHPPQHLQAI